MKGAGDLIARITKATGIDKIAKAVLGEDCGCDERQEFLNELIPFTKEQKERAYAKGFIKEVYGKSTLTPHEVGLVWELFRTYINPRKKNSTCGKCVKDAIKQLKTKLDAKTRNTDGVHPEG